MSVVVVNERGSKYEKSTRTKPQRVGRVCAMWNCDTILSMYNTESLCAVHQRHDLSSIETRVARWLQEEVGG